MPKFQDPDSKQTLQEGLDEYYAIYEGLVRTRGASQSAREFFRCHDAAHVVFGCSTRLVDEASVKIWSFFGTTEGFRLIAGYRAPESQEIYETLSWSSIASTALRALVFAPRVFVRCRRMNKRWPWSDFDDFLGTPLLDLRREFGIAILPLG